LPIVPTVKYFVWSVVKVGAGPLDEPGAKPLLEPDPLLELDPLLEPDPPLDPLLEPDKVPPSSTAPDEPPLVFELPGMGALSAVPPCGPPSGTSLALLHARALTAREDERRKGRTTVPRRSYPRIPPQHDGDIGVSPPRPTLDSRDCEFFWRASRRTVTRRLTGRRDVPRTLAPV
jgi:hypothetical protein